MAEKAIVYFERAALMQPDEVFAILNIIIIIFIFTITIMAYTQSSYRG